METGSTKYTKPPPSTCRRSVINFTLIATLLVVVGAGIVFVGYRANQREEAAEAAYPPIGEILQIGSQKIHAVVQGSGPDLVVIHGASANLRTFTGEFADTLAQRYRVILLDRPGFGWSSPLPADADGLAEQARILQSAAAALGAHKPVVVGHSYGGAVALAWATSLPDTVSAVVPLGGAAQVWEGPVAALYRRTATKLGSALLVPLITAFVPKSYVDKAIDDTFTPQQAPTGYGDKIGTPLSLRRETMRINSRQRVRLKDEIRAMVPLYPSISIPMEIVHGTADNTIPFEIHAAPLARDVPTAVLTPLEGIGHMPHVPDPQPTFDAIDRAASRAGLR